MTRTRRPCPCIPSFKRFGLLSQAWVDICAKYTIIEESRYNSDFMTCANSKKPPKCIIEILWIVFPHNKLEDNPHSIKSRCLCQCQFPVNHFRGKTSFIPHSCIVYGISRYIVKSANPRILIVPFPCFICTPFFP